MRRGAGKQIGDSREGVGSSFDLKRFHGLLLLARAVRVGMNHRQQAAKAVAVCGCTRVPRHSPISSCFAGRMKRFSAEDEHVTKKPTKTQSRSSPIL